MNHVTLHKYDLTRDLSSHTIYNVFFNIFLKNFSYHNYYYEIFFISMNVVMITM